MRAAIYVRNSTEEQHNSPERQLSQVRPYCQSKKYDIVGEYQDVAMRGHDDSRPQFQKLLADAKRGLFDVIVVDEQSRLTRNNPLDFFGKVALPLKEAGVALDTVARGVRDWDDLASIILQTVDQHQSNAEVQTLSRRVATELARKALAGHAFLNKPAFGYKKVWVKEATGEVVHEGNRAWVGRPPQGVVPKLHVNEDEAKVVRWIFDAYLKQDLSVNGIRTELEQRGVLSPIGRPHWSRTYLRQILTNAMYVGDYQFNRRTRGAFHRISFKGDDRAPQVVKKPKKGELDNPREDWVVITDSHPPLVSRDDFARVQALLKNNRERRSPGTARDDYPLGNLLVCSHCGSFMSGDRVSMKKDRPGKGVKFYICAGYMRWGKSYCNPYRVLEADMLQVVLQVITNYFLNPDKIEELRAQVRTLRDQQNSDDTKVAMAKQVQELDRRIKRAVDNLTQLDPEFIAGAQKQIKRWKAELSALMQVQEEAENHKAGDLNFGDDVSLQAVSNALRDASPQRQRPVLRSILARVTLGFRTEKKHVRFRYSLDEANLEFHSGMEVKLEAGRA